MEFYEHFNAYGSSINRIIARFDKIEQRLSKLEGQSKSVLDETRLLKAEAALHYYADRGHRYAREYFGLAVADKDKL